MNLKENILLIFLVFNQVSSLRIRVERDENATVIIKETQERINKNIYNNSESEIETCGGIFSQSQFLIESPNYPSNYPNNLNCLFIFKGPYCDTNYTLQFLDFNLENSLGCSEDRLEIKEKDAICGLRDGIKTYNSKSGTLVLNFITNQATSARGFRILVSRSYCNYNVPSEVTTCNPTVHKDFESDVNFNPFPKNPSSGPTQDNSPYPAGSNPSYPPNALYPNTKQPACCASAYNTKRFYISSPGFPLSYTTPTECQFTIFRANPKVCRLRIHFNFFWHGIQNPTCTHGYLQIDGKLICGCHTRMKLVSPFDGSFGNSKVFRFKNVGFPSEIFSGFVIEVIQDECPTRYVPADRKFHFYNDEIYRVAWPNTSHIQRDTEVFESVDLGYKPKVIKHVYFFNSPELTDDNYDVGYVYNKPRDVEETTYLETADLDLSYASDITICRSWGVSQWNLLNKDILWKRMPKCNVINNRPEGSRCKEYTFIKGYFQSPGYPYFYPKNSNTCYRFYKQMGFCKIRLVMVDFHVEDSFDCLKDYLVLNGNLRYCGRSLANTFTLFDMSGKSYEEIRFISDMQGSGRGFRGIYEQIPCSGLTQVPEISIWTTISTLPHLPGTTIKPPINIPCSNTIKDNYFTIDIYDYGKETCNFIVETNNENICELELELITLDFPCDSEYILIHGERYCGKLSGQTIKLNFTEKVEIVYKRLTSDSKLGLKLHLVGRQIDCEVKLPPAARISDVSRRSGKQDFISIVTQKDPEKSEEVSVVLKRRHKEVCGIIMNTKSVNSTESICNFIKNNVENVECNPITSKTIYVPYNVTSKLELKFESSAILEDIEFKEITCDNKFIL